VLAIDADHVETDTDTLDREDVREIAFVHTVVRLGGDSDGVATGAGEEDTKATPAHCWAGQYVIQVTQFYDRESCIYEPASWTWRAKGRVRLRESGQYLIHPPSACRDALADRNWSESGRRTWTGPIDVRIPGLGDDGSCGLHGDGKLSFVTGDGTHSVCADRPRFIEDGNRMRGHHSCRWVRSDDQQSGVSEARRSMRWELTRGPVRRTKGREADGRNDGVLETAIHDICTGRLSGGPDAARRSAAYRRP